MASEKISDMPEGSAVNPNVRIPAANPSQAGDNVSYTAETFVNAYLLSGLAGGAFGGIVGIMSGDGAQLYLPGDGDGNINLLGAQKQTAGDGGYANVAGGQADDVGTGGFAYLFGGHHSADGNGGDAVVNGGDVDGLGNGGNVQINPGISIGGDNGFVIITNLPTSDPGVPGALYVLAGVIKISL